MQIELSLAFIAQLQSLLEFIAQDSVENALKFECELLARIENLSSMPRKYRQSIHFSDPNIRDFIFKGYVVPYLIDSANNKLVILGIRKWNLWNPSDL